MSVKPEVTPEELVMLAGVPQVLFTIVYSEFDMTMLVLTRLAFPVLVSVTVWLGLEVAFCGTEPIFSEVGLNVAMGAMGAITSGCG